jgi:hypothetical protein
MRGYPLYNFPAFARATRMWRERGYDVVSPAEHDLQMGFNPEIATDEQGFDVQAALRWDIEQLLSPDMEAIYMLDGWEASFGASTEHAVAAGIGLERFYETPKDEARYIYREHTAVAR